MAKFCEVFLERPHLAYDPRFVTNVERVRNRSETDRCVAEAFAGIDACKASRLLLEAEIAYANVNNMAGLAAHPHLQTIVVQTPMGPVELPAPAAIVIGDGNTAASQPSASILRLLSRIDRLRPAEVPLIFRGRPLETAIDESLRNLAMYQQAICGVRQRCRRVFAPQF